MLQTMFMQHFIDSSCLWSFYQASGEEPEITDEGGSAKILIITGENNGLVKLYAHKRNSSSIGGAWPPSAPG